MSGTGRGRLIAAIDWAFRDRQTGAIVIAQRPNLPLWLFLALSALAWASAALGPVAARWQGWLREGAAVALAWWAMSEILQGVNPWRRFLGAIVFVGLIAATTWRFTS